MTYILIQHKTFKKGEINYVKGNGGGCLSKW
jgi:hypothetical protein